MSEGMFRNQVGIIDIDEFDWLKLAIIGTGSIGSFLALALNKLGFRNIMLIDDDKVEKHNPATQFFFKKDIGRYKVQALGQYMDGYVTPFPVKISPKHKIKADVAFICVDSLKQRKVIMKAILDSYEKFGKPTLVIDGRMHRLLFKVYTIPLNNQELVKTYVKSMMGKEFKGKCTEKGIVQNVFAVVSTMVEQMKKVIKGEDYHAVINADFEQYKFVKQSLQTWEKRKQ